MRAEIKALAMIRSLLSAYAATLAEVSEEQKNAISHRGRALAQLIAYMKEAEQK